MTFRTIACAGALALAATAPGAQAAVLTFDLGGLRDFFSFPSASVTGGFTFDTATSGFSAIAIATPIGSYGGGSGTLIPDTASFGFPEDIFSFDNGATTFFFSVEGLNLAAPDVPAGGGTTFSNVFAFEGDAVNDDFQIDPFGNSASYFGDVTVSAADVAPVPLPAALPLLVAGLGALGALRRRRNRT